MSSALKPVLTSAGAQNPPVPSQLNKPMHPQGASATYGQPVSHIPQNLVNIPHNPPSSTNVHNPPHSNTHTVPHHINTNTHATSHSANHYSLNVPNASQHYPVSGNAPVSSHSTPISNHPVSNTNQAHTQPVSTFSSPPKNLSYSPNFQTSVGHPYKPINVTSTQNVPAPQPAVSSTPEEPPAEKPQSNGTSEVKVTAKSEPPQNHVSPPSFKEKPPPPSPTPPVQTPSLPEKPKLSPEKSENNSAPTTTTIEPKQSTDVNKVSENSSTVVETVEKTSVQVEPTPTVTTTTSSVSEVSNADAVSSSETLPSSTVAVAAESETNATVKATPTPTPAITSPTPPTPPPPPPPPPVSTATVAVPAESTVPSSSSNSPQATNNTVNTEEVQEPVANKTTTLGAPVQNKSKEQSNQKSTLKLATTPRTPVRKAKAPKLDVADASKTPNKTETKSPLQKSSGSGGKAKRARTKTQPYQSPLPEVEMISKITATTPKSRNTEEKLIVFYKNEFLAVRNSEGGFYVCQAMQNIYKRSPRIRIRWLSQDKGDKEVYSPDFYDYTDFDCILTNLNLERVDKSKYKLPPNERIRTDSILKRALAVEKGDATPPSLTEEHPDGLDLSLYKKESQLKKPKAVKRRASSPLKASPKSNTPKKSPDQAKVRKIISKPKVEAVKKSTVLKKALSAKLKKPDPPVVATTTTAAIAAGRAERAAKRKLPEPPKPPATKTSPVIDLKKAKVLAKVARKPPPAGPPPKTLPPPKQIPKAVKQVAAPKKPVAATAAAIAKKEKPPVVTRQSKRGKK